MNAEFESLVLVLELLLRRIPMCSSRHHPLVDAVIHAQGTRTSERNSMMSMERERRNSSKMRQKSRRRGGGGNVLCQVPFHLSSSVFPASLKRRICGLSVSPNRTEQNSSRTKEAEKMKEKERKNSFSSVDSRPSSQIFFRHYSVLLLLIECDSSRTYISNLFLPIIIR